MKSIIETNYAATKARGLITEHTSPDDFIAKIHEEVLELCESMDGKGDPAHELSDIILVCLNAGRHWGIDVETQLIKNITNNIQR